MLFRSKAATREIRDFYTLGPDCLWITFADGHLWWAFAETEVVWLGPEEDSRGARMRMTVDGWHKVNIKGEPLRTDHLSTKLTQLEEPPTVDLTTVPLSCRPKSSRKNALIAGFSEAKTLEIIRNLAGL